MNLAEYPMIALERLTQLAMTADIRKGPTQDCQLEMEVREKEEEDRIGYKRKREERGG